MLNIAEDFRSTKLKDARVKDGVLYRSEWNEQFRSDLLKQLSKWAKVTAKIEVYLTQDLRTDQLVRDVLDIVRGIVHVLGNPSRALCRAR